MCILAAPPQYRSIDRPSSPIRTRPGLKYATFCQPWPGLDLITKRRSNIITPEKSYLPLETKESQALDYTHIISQEKWESQGCYETKDAPVAEETSLYNSRTNNYGDNTNASLLPVISIHYSS
jgi:hypothetical protein